MSPEQQIKVIIGGPVTPTYLALENEGKIGNAVTLPDGARLLIVEISTMTRRELDDLLAEEQGTDSRIFDSESDPETVSKIVEQVEAKRKRPLPATPEFLSELAAQEAAAAALMAAQDEDDEDAEANLADF